MGVSYDEFTSAFLQKVREYDFIEYDEEDSTSIIDGYMKRACAAFNNVCAYDLVTGDDEVRELDADIDEKDLYQIIDIVTDGMVVQWLKQFVYHQENYENLLNTRDFTSYSPAELLYRIKSMYEMCRREFLNHMKDYSYSTGDLTDLHI